MNPQGWKHMTPFSVQHSCLLQLWAQLFPSNCKEEISTFNILAKKPHLWFQITNVKPVWNGYHPGLLFVSYFCCLCQGNQIIVTEGDASFPRVCLLQDWWHLWETYSHTSHSRRGELLALQMSVGNCEFRDTSFSDRNLSCVEISTEISVVETWTVLSQKTSYSQYFL